MWKPSWLHHGGTWEESLALNGPNAAGVCVAGSEPLFLGWACLNVSAGETGSVLLDLLTGRLLTASFCIEGVTCIWLNCRATVCDLTEHSHLLELEKGWFWCWDCPWSEEQAAGRALWKAVAVVRLGLVFSLWHYSLSGKWLSRLYLILELHSLTP